MIILRQKEYARRDYEGLTEAQAKMKMQDRSRLAKEIVDARKKQDLQAKKVAPALSTSGKSTYVGGYVDLGGKNQISYKVGFDKPLDFKKVKELQKGDRMIQNTELLREADIRKREIDSKYKRKSSLISKQQPKPQTKEVTEGFLKRNWNKLGTGGKIAAIGVPVAAAAVGTGLAIKKHNDKKKSQEKSFSKIKHTIEHGEDKGGKYTITKYHDPETGEMREEKNYISKKPSKIC